MKTSWKSLINLWENIHRVVKVVNERRADRMIVESDFVNLPEIRSRFKESVVY